MSNTDSFPREIKDWVTLHQQDRIKNAKQLEASIPDNIKNDNPDIDYDALFEYFDKKNMKVTRKVKRNLTNAEKAGPKDSEIKYPFKTKVKAYANKHNLSMEELKSATDSHVKDYRLPDLVKKFKRPDYAIAPHSYEMDIMFAAGNGQQRLKQYLILININTRYMIAIPLASKNTKDVIAAFEKALRVDPKIKFLKHDGEGAFTSSEFVTYLSGIGVDVKRMKKENEYEEEGDNKGITSVSDSSKYTYHNKIIDSAIRTIRNASGLSYEILRNDSNMQAIVNYYNNTPHNSLPVDENGIHYTPLEMQNNIDAEWRYIRDKDRQLKDVFERIKDANLDKYEPGNILLLHLDHGRDSESMKKKRRNFADIGEFIAYEHGNVKCRRLNTAAMETITVPIFYTKRVAKNIDTLPKKYRDMFNV